MNHRPVLCGLLAVTVASVAAQQTVNKKTYTDAETGVSFRYPAAWTRYLAQTYGANPLLEEGKETARAADVRFKAGYIHVKPDPGDKTQGVAFRVNFSYAVLPETTAETCAMRFKNWNFTPGADDPSKPPPDPTEETINGVTYRVVDDSEAGLGHSWHFVVYTLFRNGRCLGFSVGDETAHTDAPPRVKRRVSMEVDAVMQSAKFK